eukprot:TRINITY_DN25679_c0_g1_i1.p1 TRINITY_DN25679_c0_g1~~TRINITY_DN25679_c0_g1_i1.p1  ORF type:complete len:538 (-),score=58.00 TRINITY_DN25679_c0_g1_i1:79-1692(-)
MTSTPDQSDHNANASPGSSPSLSAISAEQNGHSAAMANLTAGIGGPFGLNLEPYMAILRDAQEKLRQAEIARQQVDEERDAELAARRRVEEGAVHFQSRLAEMQTILSAKDVEIAQLRAQVEAGEQRAAISEQMMRALQATNHSIESFVRAQQNTDRDTHHHLADENARLTGAIRETQEKMEKLNHHLASLQAEYDRVRREVPGHAYFGIDCMDTEEGARPEGGSSHSGAIRVVKVFPPAETAGIQPEDIITTISGVPVTDIHHFKELVTLRPLRLSVWRPASLSTHQFELFPQSRPPPPPTPVPPPPPGAQATVASPPAVPVTRHAHHVEYAESSSSITTVPSVASGSVPVYGSSQQHTGLGRPSPHRMRVTPSSAASRPSVSAVRSMPTPTTRAPPVNSRTPSSTAAGRAVLKRSTSPSGAKGVTAAPPPPTVAAIGGDHGLGGHHPEEMTPRVMNTPSVPPSPAYGGIRSTAWSGSRTPPARGVGGSTATSSTVTAATGAARRVRVSSPPPKGTGAAGRPIVVVPRRASSTAHH